MKMEAVFLSNFYNHHQMPVSRALYHHLGGKYTFIATTPMDDERRAMGYKVIDDPFVLQYENSEDLCQEYIDRADLVILGDAPYKLIKQCSKRKQLVFRYSERPLKMGFEPLKYLPRLLKWRLSYPVGDNTYLLCASAYTSADYAKFGMYNNKAYKWGYFPEAKLHDIDHLFTQKHKNQVVSILWVGRLIGWKHPDVSILVAEKLRNERIPFSLSIIGNGAMEEELNEMIKEKSLSECVKMLGAMSPEQVRDQMEHSDIFLFTSDRNEGWGAVLNESMNSGCAVVASHAIGSVPYLIRHSENGLVYHSGNVDELFEKVKYLIDRPHERERLGKAAYDTINGEWNAEVAAERLIKLSERLLAGKKHPDLYKTGPCSRAKALRDNWFHE